MNVRRRSDDRVLFCGFRRIEIAITCVSKGVLGRLVRSCTRVVSVWSERRIDVRDGIFRHYWEMQSAIENRGLRRTSGGELLIFQCSTCAEPYRTVFVPNEEDAANLCLIPHRLPLLAALAGKKSRVRAEDADRHIAPLGGRCQPAIFLFLCDLVSLCIQLK